MGRPGRPAARVARARRRRLHPQAPRLGIRRRAAQGRLVEMEDRSAHRRRRAHLRAARQRPPRQPAHRLHLRRLGRGRSSCRSRRRTRDCRTRRSKSSTSGSADTRASGMARCAPSSRSRSSSSASRPSRRRRGIKSGIAVRFPRMLRWRQDKPAAEADTLDFLQETASPAREHASCDQAAGIARCERFWVVTFTLLAGSAVLPSA